VAEGSGRKKSVPALATGGTPDAHGAHAGSSVDAQAVTASRIAVGLNLEGANAGPPEGAPTESVAETDTGRPMLATVAIYLMLATGAIALALSLYWMFWGNNILGGTIVLLLGIAYVYGGRALRKGESWGWGAGVFAGIFVLLFGLFLLPYAAVLIVLAIVVIVLLFRVRDYFGMVRYDREGEERTKKELETTRTSNPEGLHCPHCGSARLWVAPDGSAFCQNCRAGTISLKRAA